MESPPGQLCHVSLGDRSGGRAGPSPEFRARGLPDVLTKFALSARNWTNCGDSGASFSRTNVEGPESVRPTGSGPTGVASVQKSVLGTRSRSRGCERPVGGQTAQHVLRLEVGAQGLGGEDGWALVRGPVFGGPTWSGRVVPYRPSASSPSAHRTPSAPFRVSFRILCRKGQGAEDAPSAEAFASVLPTHVLRTSCSRHGVRSPLQRAEVIVASGPPSKGTLPRPREKDRQPDRDT